MSTSYPIPHIQRPLVHRIDGVVRLLGLSRATIYRLVKSGDLKLVKLGQKASGITDVSLRQWAASRGITY
jgi:predicted DNA-binding transcriptional regulator AlpA